MFRQNSINQLILFTIYTLQKEGKECSFAKLVEECFRNFPQNFALKYHSQWPDTRKLDRPLRDLRKKKLIKKNSEKGFSLTLSGKKIAQTIAKTFRQQRLNLK